VHSFDLLSEAKAIPQVEFLEIHPVKQKVIVESENRREIGKAALLSYLNAKS
jgi:hypothetical protein